MLGDHQAALVALSSNARVHKYLETDAEALLMAVKGYVMLSEAGKGAEATAYMEAHIRKKTGISPVFGAPESRDFVLRLYKLEGHIGHTTAFSTRWIREHILNIYGGVSDIRVNIKTG